MYVSASQVLVLLLLGLNLMAGVRYIFRFGEPLTSPTYSVVPFEYLLVRAALLGLILIVIVSRTKKLSVNWTMAYLVVLSAALLCFVQAESTYVRGVARNVAFYGLCFLCIYSNYGWIKIRQINRVFEFLAVFGLVFLGYQVMQYHLFNVLPAHSHDGQLVRYGSFYDDSLVLGLLLPMFAGYFFNKFRSVAALSLTASIVCVVAILTGSMTAMVITFVYVAWNLRRRLDLLLVFICIFLSLFVYYSDQVVRLLEFKSGSIDGHLEGWRKFEEMRLLTLSGYYPLDMFAESDFLMVLYNLGLPVLAVIVAVHVMTFRASQTLLRVTKVGTSERAFAGATEGLTVSVFLASLNLPVLIISPVYLFFAILSALALKQVRARTLHHDVVIPRYYEATSGLHRG